MRKKKKKILGVCGDPNAVSVYRIIRPIEKYGGDVVRNDRDEKLVFGEIHKKFSKYDIVITKYHTEPQIIAELLAAKEASGTKLYIDYDDNVYNVPPGNVAEVFWHNEAQLLLEFFTQNCDGIIASTPYLANALSPLHKNIITVPNLIDSSEWKMDKVHTRKTDAKIGWTFSKTHIPDAFIYRFVITTLKAKYPKLNFEITDGQFKGAEMVRGCSFLEFPEKLQSFDWDIAVAPLIDNEFNRSKSNIKWLEASMAGAVFVGANVEPYKTTVKHGVTGFLCTTHKEWVDTIEYLINNPEVRQQVVSNAQKEILENYDIQTRNPLQEVIDSL